jgi:hypothetical protein
MTIKRCAGVAVKYKHLVEKTREVAGGCMRTSWAGDGAGTDAQMNISNIDFAPLEDYEEACLTTVAGDLPAWKFWR